MTRALLPGLLLLLLAGTPGADEGPDVLAGLPRALRSGDVEVRRVALREVERVAPSLSESRRRRTAVRLRRHLEDEREPRVRAAALLALARLGGTTGWVPVVLAWTSERDPEVRAAARRALLWGGGDYLEVVARLLAEDEDPTFRARLALLLGDRRRPDAVPLLVEVLGEEHPRVQAAAAEALEAITGRALGYDAEAWAGWWETRQERAEPPPDDGGETVTVAEPDRVPETPEPRPHVTRSLHPEFYGLVLHAKDLVFVLDISGSVGTGGVARAKRELVDALERLGSDVHVTALFFDEEVHLWKPEMVPATPEHKADLAYFLRAIRPGRRTDVFTPLNAGIQILRRRVEEKLEAGEPFREAVTMIVVSDGVETSARTPPAVVAEKLERLDPARTVVHAVTLGGEGSPLMAELARRGGGHYVVVR